MIQKLMIAGGGTGGHIFPGICVAELWKQQGGEVIFVGTLRGQEKNLVPKHGFEIDFIPTGSLKGKGVFTKLLTLIKIPRALLYASRIIKKYKPQMVLGIGGYASGPTLLVAWVMGLPTAVTEQNAHPGVTNRTLAKIVDKVFVSYPESKRFFPLKKVYYVGNPVRSGIEHCAYEKPKDKFCIFVFGGSQGAVTLNEIFTKSLKRLPQLKDKFKIIHQAGKHDLQELKGFYKKEGIEAEVSSFFDNMNDLYKNSHLVICRAGAGTMTELAMSGRPAILVPYPFAADDHQKKNARIFEVSKAGWMMEQKTLSAERLAEKIYNLWKDPEQLEQAAAQAYKLAKPHATEDLVSGLKEK